mgnify:CR=1 FL=1|tara:strand:- start:760 stop:1167 length:408 start_codon:yes stop_codon:yes gene_type:complete
MGVTFNGSRGGRKTTQEIAKLATEAHNKKRVVITSAEPIKFLKIPTKEVDKESSVNVADLVDAVKNIEEIVVTETNLPLQAQVVEDEESPEEKLRYELSTMKKAGLKEYASDNNVDLGDAKTNEDITNAIVLALT